MEGMINEWINEESKKITKRIITQDQLLDFYWKCAAVLHMRGTCVCLVLGQSDFEYIVSHDKCKFLRKYHYAMLLKYSPQWPVRFPSY